MAEIQKLVYPLTSYHTYAADTTTQVDLPDQGYITQIDCLLHLNVTPDTAVTPFATDDLIRIISSSEVKGARARTFFDINDARLWYYWNYFNYEGQLRCDSLPAGGAGATDVYCNFTIHLGFDVTDPFDKSVVIPARNVRNLKHNVSWGSASDLGTGFTVNSGDMKLTVYEVVLPSGTLESEVWPNGFINPRMESRTHTIANAYSNLSLVEEVPVGDIMYQAVVMVTGTVGGLATERNDVDITELAVKFPGRRSTPYEYAWQGLKSRTRTLYRTPADVAGVTMIPWEDLGAGPLGLDLTPNQVGDCELRFTTAAALSTGAKLHYLYMLNS